MHLPPVRTIQTHNAFFGSVGNRSVVGGNPNLSVAESSSAMSDDIVKKLGHNCSTEFSEAEIHHVRNDWKGHPDGQAFKVEGDHSGGGSASDQGRLALDPARREFEVYFASYIEDAK